MIMGRAYGSSDANTALTQYMVPHVMALAGTYAQAVQADDVETARG
jgi:hypothetical protein